MEFKTTYYITARGKDGETFKAKGIKTRDRFVEMVDHIRKTYPDHSLKFWKVTVEPIEDITVMGLNEAYKAL